jgi:cyclomaltodextrinase / maltogenic alpha-amylase / neopullulanase
VIDNTNVHGNAYDIWYHIYPFGFLAAEQVNPAPGARGGPIVHRLSDLVGWLDYLKDLGITAVLLGPVFESESHGYDVVDPFRIDRRLGDEADFKQFLDECHLRSLRVGLDLVLHHVGRAHPYFQDVLRFHRQSEWCNWFEIDFERPGPDGFSYANFESHHQLVKLNHSNSQVLEWAVDLATFWMNRGVDAFRLDAAYAIPPHFLASFSNRLRSVRSDVLLLGEVIHGNYVESVQQGRLTTVTQYELWKAIWSALNDRNFFELSHALKRHAAFCKHFLPWTFIGNHDTTRIATRLVDERHLEHALVVLFTLPGTPAVYAADEQGAQGQKFDRAGGDEEVRQPPPHLPGVLPSCAQTVWKLHRDLIAVRREHPWIATGDLSVSEVNNRFIQYEVRSDSRRLVTFLNIDDKPLPYGVLTGLIRIAGSSEVPLPPHGWAVWTTSSGD